MSDQMRRSVVSVASNIAEGQARNSTKEFQQFLSISLGSNAELYTQLTICLRIGYLNEVQTEKAFLLIEEINKMIFSLKNKLPSQS